MKNFLKFAYNRTWIFIILFKELCNIFKNFGKNFILKNLIIILVFGSFFSLTVPSFSGIKNWKIKKKFFNYSIYKNKYKNFLIKVPAGNEA